MSRAFGIVNFAGNNIQGNPMQAYRPTGAISFLGRYRVIDFPISNMSNSGIDQIQVYVNQKPRSLAEHLGTGFAITISIPNEENYSFSFPKNRLRIRCMIQILLHTWRTWSVLNTLPVLT